MQIRTTIIRPAVAGLCLFLILSPGCKRARRAPAPSAAVQFPWDTKWTEVPGRQGVEQAILWGNPNKEAHGLLTKFARGTENLHQKHRSGERGVVVSGTFIVGLENQDQKQLAPGSYLFVPAGVTHTEACTPDADCILFTERLGMADANSAPADPDPSPRVSMLDLGEKNPPPGRLLRGLHDSVGAWRWTERVFSVSLDPPATERPVFLELDLAMADTLMPRFFESATLAARVNGVSVGSTTYTKPGRYTFSKPVPARALKGKRETVEFELDKSAKPDGPAGREVALIAVSVALIELESTQQFLDKQAREAREGYQEILQKRKLHLSVAKQQELMRLFHDLDVWRKMWFLGIPIIKNPCDLWIMQQILCELRPDYVIETGTWQGGSALYWAHILDGLGLESFRVITIDVQDLAGEASRRPLWKKHVRFFQGSSTDPQIVARIAEMVRGKKVLVTLDSDHSLPHVLREIRSYAPLVSPGSYLIVEDTHIDSVGKFRGWRAGPMSAVNVFLKEGGSRAFEQDFTREAMVMTFQPGGWLRKKTEGR